MTSVTKLFMIVGLALGGSLSFNSNASTYGSYQSNSNFSNYIYFYKKQYSSGYGRNNDLRPTARTDRFLGKEGELFEQNVKSNDSRGNSPHVTNLLRRSNLPDGLSLGSDGQLTGTPTESGTFYAKYIIRDADGDRSFARIKIVIDEDLQPVAENDEYSAEIGVEFTANVLTDNDTQGDGEATVELSGGELPAGLVLNLDGSISGTPTESGTFVAEYTITDADGDTSSASITISLLETISYCPQNAVSDELHNGNHSHAVWINGISRNLQFTSEAQAVRQFPNGDLTITGSVADGDIAFDIVLNYSGYTEQSDDPKLELRADAYVDNGGPIDPESWEFYSDFSATLTGTAGLWDGVVLSAALRGPMTQIGFGANGKNGNFGLANWFDATIESASGNLPEGVSIGQVFRGDVNIDLPDECPPVLLASQCSVAAAPDAYSKSDITHSILISNIPDRELLFEPEARVDTFDNGDIVITGTVVGTHSGARLNVVLEYTNATDTSPDAPRRDLIRSAYIENGGPIDTTTWTYFEGFSGTFTGVEGDATFDGVVFDAVIRGELPQLGFGANNKNLNFGLNNWFDVTVVEAPESGSRFSVGDTFIGDVNIDINDTTSEGESCGL